VPVCLVRGRLAGDFCVEGVGFLELAQNTIDITRLLDQGFRIPFAAARGEKIAAVDVNGAGETGNRICDGMNDVLSERLGVFFAEGAGSGGFEFAGGGTGNATPEDVVFAAGVNADDGPHLVIVGEERHVGAPDDVEDGEEGRAEESLDAGAGRFAEGFQDGGGIGDGTSGDIPNEVLVGVLLESRAAIADEGIQFEHRICLLLNR